MDRVEEIETAISKMPPDDYQRVVIWFREREQAQWDDATIEIRQQVNSIFYFKKPQFSNKKGRRVFQPTAP